MKIGGSGQILSIREGFRHTNPVGVLAGLLGSARSGGQDSISLPESLRALAYRELPAPFGSRDLTYTEPDHHINREMPDLAVLRCALRLRGDNRSTEPDR